ncbi:alpha/beta hydrolase [Phenylobacterium sp. LjRoot225]|uniref:alpha/beta fold hydrolase n=1 Tax=Phenylobacterium sp. LjRoot225 TaxID=3342285 RepID=UPI003ED10DF1
MSRLPMTRRDALAAGAVSAAAGLMAEPAAAAPGPAPQSGTTTYLVCHGGWSAGWVWKKMRPLLHRPPTSALYTPTYTGVGERAHLATPEVGLETHIRDVLGVIEAEELTDITLIAHSYGGMVATGVADRARDRVRRLIYLDAFVPEDGRSQFDLISRKTGPDTPWLVPPRPIPPDTSEADARWLNAHRSPQPLASFTTPLHLSGKELPPRAYIRCTRLPPDDPQKSSALKAKANGWPYVEIDTSHNPHVTAPELLASTLLRLAQVT